MSIVEQKVRSMMAVPLQTERAHHRPDLCGFAEHDPRILAQEI